MSTVATEQRSDPAQPRVKRVAERDQSPAPPRREWTLWLLGLLLLVSLGLRLAWLDKPSGGLIFDEAYYVNAARVILGQTPPTGANYATAPLGRDPNREHPPLAKLLIAGTMRLLGDNAWGWRLASVILGTLAIPALYGIARRGGLAAPAALLATFIFAFDNLIFVHSRIATLDIFVVAFILFGLYAFLIERPILAGLALALATLCKISGLYGVGALALLVIMRLLRNRLTTDRWAWRALVPLLLTSGTCAVTFVALLGLLDWRWGQITNPFEHIAHIFRYGFALSRAGGPQGQESAPWQWLLNEVQMTYLRVDTQVLVNGTARETRALIYFRGAMNPFTALAAPFAIAYAAHSAWQRRDDHSFMSLGLFVATYLPYWPAALLAQRISYIFYFLPTIPAIALGMAGFLYDPALPRVIRWSFIGAFLIGWYGYFPFRYAP
jgi:predicted membrane-bound dolichyl-phosphate-mannose-protein mannosyltransferase